MSKKPKTKPAKPALRDDATKESYDDKPYHSYPYPLSQPEHIYAVAKLMKINAVPVDKARVLELGCAGGGNLFPTAVNYPDSDCVGIDLSPVQIREADAHKAGMGLTNIRFEALDIMDLDSSYGKFDYIVCHGVFSWVPEFVREKIMQVCRDNLSPRGIAMITFNTLPGWAALGCIRDMMMMHTRHLTDNSKKVAQAKSLLTFLHKFVPEKTNLRGAVVQVAETFAKANDDSYILHEYLEENNQPFFFEEFHDYLTRHKLHYLGDSVLDKMFSGNLGAEAHALIRQINDRVKREQYMDFVHNRQFRWALISKDTLPVPAPIDESELGGLYFSTRAQPLAGKYKPEDGKFFYHIPGNLSDYESLSPVMTACIETLIEAKGAALTMDQIRRSVESCGFDEAAMALFQKTLSLLCLQAVVTIHAGPSRFAATPGEKPVAFALAKYQAGLPASTWVTSLDNKMTPVSADEAALLKTLDGKKLRAELNADDVLESLCQKKLLVS